MRSLNSHGRKLTGTEPEALKMMYQNGNTERQDIMIELGKKQVLKVAKKVEFGVYLFS